MNSITLQIGQAVTWPASPTGYAQIEDLHRRKVTVGYQAKHRWRRRRVRVDQLAQEPLLFELINPFGRALRKRARTYPLRLQRWQRSEPAGSTARVMRDGQSMLFCLARSGQADGELQLLRSRCGSTIECDGQRYRRIR